MGKLIKKGECGGCTAYANSFGINSTFRLTKLSRAIVILPSASHTTIDEIRLISEPNAKAKPMKPNESTKLIEPQYRSRPE